MESLADAARGSLPAGVHTALFQRSSPVGSSWSCNATILLIGLAYGLVFHTFKWTRFTEPRGLHMSRADRLSWHNRIMSTLSAILLLAVTAPALPTALQDSVHDRYFGYSFYQDMAARLFSGFLLFDLAWMVAYQPTVQDGDFVPYTLHHVLFLAATTYALQGSYFRFHFMWLIASEASTPFVNLRWHLAVLGNKGRLYVANGAAATLVFFTFRVALWGYMLTVVYRERYVWNGPGAPMLFPVIVSFIYAGYLLQVYWFALILKGMKRALQRASDAPSEESREKAA